MNREKTHSVDTIFVLALFCAFTAAILIILMLGTRIYSSMSKSAEIAYNENICMSYITEKIRHGDRKDAVYVDKFDGLNALFIEMKSEDVVYNDIIYYYDGYLQELYCQKGTDFLRTDGTKIINAESVTFSEIKAGLFYIEATDLNGKTSRQYISMRSGG